jgi:hypothetical protein
VKRRALERHLREHDCHEVGGTKHAKWRGPRGLTAVPRHNEIGPGLVRKICQQLGVAAPRNPR